jgi:hypothetical protein
MKKTEKQVYEVKVAELRERLKEILSLKKPWIVYRNSRPVGILLAVETTWFGRLEHPVLESRRLRAELDAVLAKLNRTFTIE